jgi:hypothetical protein
MEMRVVESSEDSTAWDDGMLPRGDESSVNFAVLALARRLRWRAAVHHPPNEESFP